MRSKIDIRTDEEEERKNKLHVPHAHDNVMQRENVMIIRCGIFNIMKNALKKKK